MAVAAELVAVAVALAAACIAAVPTLVLEMAHSPTAAPSPSSSQVVRLSIVHEGKAGGTEKASA